jgi:hypothetical protein
MEREGQEPSGEPSQAAEEEQNRVAEKRRIVMAVTWILDSGTLDEKSLRLLEQLADCAQRPRVRSTREAEPVKQAAAQQVTPARGEPVETEPAEVPTGEPSSNNDSGHNTEEKVIVGSLRTMSEDRWTCKVPSCTGGFHSLKDCRLFLDPEDRFKLADQHSLCRTARSCPYEEERADAFKRTACRKRHHYLLHVEERKAKKGSGKNPPAWPPSPLGDPTPTEDLRWQMADGTVQCRLLAGKTRVAPKCKISIPRMELMGALLAVRLARKIQDSLQMELEAVRYFTDSAVALGMILRESATYQEFVGTRVSEIRTKMDPETEWFWIPGEMNIADMGTRPTMVPKEMGPGSPYQEGLPWMRGPPEMWPAKKTFAPPPPEECKKDMLAMVKTTRVRSGLWYLPSVDTQAKLERVYGYVYTFLAGARKLANFMPITKRSRIVGKETVTTHSPPAEQYREAARLCLLQDVQANIENGGLKGLAVESRAYSVEGFAAKEILTLGGRQKNYLRVAYDRGDLPVLPARHLLSRLYLEEAHRMDHAGVDAMVMRSRSQVWITRVRPKAKVVKKACFACKRSARRLGEQKMAPLPEHRMGPMPPFFSTAVDLFGPLPISGSVNKRSTGKHGESSLCAHQRLWHMWRSPSHTSQSPS